MKGTGLTHPQDIISTPLDVQRAVLAAGTGQAFDIPALGSYVVFGSNVDFLVRWGSTAAAVPTTSSTAASTSDLTEMNPTARNVGSTADTTGFSVIAATTGIVTMSWFTR